MENQDAFQIAELLKTPSKESKNSFIYDQQQNSEMMYRCISNIEVSASVTNATPKSNNCNKRINNETTAAFPSSASTNMMSTMIIPKRLFASSSEGHDSTATSSTTTSSTSSSTSTTPPRHVAFNRKRSIALGNGWNAKGLTKARQGKWQQALACWDNALEIRQQMMDSSSQSQLLEVANTWNNRGIALGKLGQYDRAIQSLQQAYEIRASHLGKTNSQVASTLHNIANVHQQQGNLTLALQVFGKAKNLLLQLSNNNNSDDEHEQNMLLAARICTAIGHVYYQAQQWVDSKDAYQDALNVLLQSSNKNKNKKEQQRAIYELQRDIQELDAKIMNTNNGNTILIGTSGCTANQRPQALY